MKVELSEEAHSQVLAIDKWWRDNRLTSPDLFTDELDQALLRLEELPTIGTPYLAAKIPVRRLLLRRSHYYVYFREEPERVLVIAVWSAYRGRGPRL